MRCPTFEYIAALAVECAGSFKQQHDTDKDLKFVHVYPRVELLGKGGQGSAAEEAPTDLKDLGSPAYLATACTFETFKKMVASKTQSWSQVSFFLFLLKCDFVTLVKC